MEQELQRLMMEAQTQVEVAVEHQDMVLLMILQTKQLEAMAAQE
jgi:hypothetical protein